MAKQHEIEAKKAQLIDSYGPDGLAQMVIKLESERDALAVREALKSVKVDCIGYTWDAGRFGRQFTADRDVAVRVQQDGVDVQPVAIVPQSLSAAQRLIDEAGE